MNKYVGVVTGLVLLIISSSCQVADYPTRFTTVEKGFPAQWVVNDDKDGVVVKNTSSDYFIIMAYILSRDKNAQSAELGKNGSGVVSLLPGKSQFIGYPDNSPRADGAKKSPVYFKIKYKSVLHSSRIPKP